MLDRAQRPDLGAALLLRFSPCADPSSRFTAIAVWSGSARCAPLYTEPKPPLPSFSEKSRVASFTAR